MGQNLKLGFLLAFAFVFCFTTCGVYAETKAETNTTILKFDDMPDNWSTDSLYNAASNGLMKGYKGTSNIKPNETMTRAELVGGE